MENQKPREQKGGHEVVERGKAGTGTCFVSCSPSLPSLFTYFFIFFLPLVVILLEVCLIHSCSVRHYRLKMRQVTCRSRTQQTKAPSDEQEKRGGEMDARHKRFGCTRDCVAVNFASAVGFVRNDEPVSKETQGST